MAVCRGRGGRLVAAALLVAACSTSARGERLEVRAFGRPPRRAVEGLRPARAGGAAAVSRRRPQVATLMLLSTAGRSAEALENTAGGSSGPIASSDDVAKELFSLLDRDRNGLISYEEYMDAAKGMVSTKQMSYSSIFSQADITDDGNLCMEEFDFASFLAKEEDLVNTYRAYAKMLPPNFAESIDGLFFELRSRSKEGKVGLNQIVSGMRRLLLIKDDEQVDHGFMKTLIDMYDKANIIPDGTLNLNELDYMHFLVRDVMIVAAVEEASRGQRGTDESVDSTFLNNFFHKLDANADRVLSLEELVKGLEKAFAGANARLNEEGIEETRRHFADADADGNGSLSMEEAKDFLERMTRWAKVAE